MSERKMAQKRHEAIKELVKRHMVQDQDSLVRLLKDEFDIETNQSIVSRDVRQLGIVKRPVGDLLVYEFTQDPTRDILRLAHVRVEKNEFLIVVHTLGGLATFIGDYLDQHHDLGILATLAGENVVFVTPKTVKKIDEVYTKICTALYMSADALEKK